MLLILIREDRTLKMLMYFGATPEMSFENGYDPAAIWLPIVASINENATKNFAARDSKLAMTAGMYLSSFRTIASEARAEFSLPLEVAPKIRVGTCNENGGQGTKCTDHRKCKVLVISGKVVLRKATEVGHVYLWFALSTFGRQFGMGYKSSSLTAMLENSPIMTLSAVNEE